MGALSLFGLYAMARTARRWRIELRRVLQVGDESKVKLLDETLGTALVGQTVPKQIGLRSFSRDAALCYMGIE